MANDDFDWDEVLVTNRPYTKEVEVSFTRVDGDGFLGSGDAPVDIPGTPPGATEDENGCINTVELVSEDTFNYQSSLPHYVWLVFNTIPAEYMEVDLVFTDGTNMAFADDAYKSQALTFVINPGSYESDSTGFVGKKVPLLTGDLSDEISGGATTGNYFGEIVAVRGFSTGDNTPCFTGGTVSIDFGTEAIVDPTPNPEGGPVPGNNPECEPFACNEYTKINWTEEGEYGGLTIWDFSPTGTDFYELVPAPTGGLASEDWYNYLNNQGDPTGIALGAVSWAPSPVLDEQLLPWDVTGTACITTQPYAINFSGLGGSATATTTRTKIANFEDTPQTFLTTYLTPEATILRENAQAISDFGAFPYTDGTLEKSVHSISQTFWVVPQLGSAPYDPLLRTIGMVFRTPAISMAYRRDVNDANTFADGFTKFLKQAAIGINFNLDGSISYRKTIPNNSNGTSFEDRRLNGAWDPDTPNLPIEVEFFVWDEISLDTRFAEKKKLRDQTLSVIVRHGDLLTSADLLVKNEVQTPADSVVSRYRVIKDSHPLRGNVLRMDDYGLNYVTSSGDYGLFIVAMASTGPDQTPEDFRRISSYIRRSFEGHTAPDYCNRIT